MMFRNSVRSGLILVAILFAFVSSAAALETPAREAILVDHDTGAVLLAKKPDTKMPPASMTKIMTAYLVFEHLKDGRLSLDDTFVVSEKAWRKGGSKMFVEVGKEVRVEDLLRGVIVQSGNDASIVLAEGIAGTEEAFGEMMTETAHELGMSNSTFQNATGWPHEDHRTTARDLATLSKHIISDFPEHYHFFSELEFTWNDIRQYNRNPLLRRNMGVDGLKTGHTQNAGYGLTASAERDGRRLILVVNGLNSAKQRASESARLLEWGFREFQNYALYEAGDTVEEAPVWLGEADRVPLKIREDLKITLPRTARESMTVTVTYDSPVPAPIREGQEIATLRVEAPDMETVEVPLEAGMAVDQLGPLGRIVSSLEYLVFGAP
ncbi:D-alanyl-D-alanine carboxypeptidase family protein [Ferruginivarius sediminum]|uniref:serine-type D-Ala-D-Ala carboxypeptidase n=1 Tax=Ferruginivarius sediminum TaxID=2661937 RepID=A0A369T9R4_9PROT|nr:D-alanyl-D-alanine carboxypeptidase family protein [Ferruginivarius sediminum]RDD62028.1 D-alanyl-D-alanine carboxypeptidase [Ferruginivarius sediminum]